MKKLILLSGMFAAGLGLSAAAATDQVYYVQSTKAKILSAPSFRSSVITEVGMGQSLSFKSKDGSWIKVTFGGKEGYVSSLLVSTHQPLRHGGYIKAEDSEIKQGVRRRSSAFASAAAARGLTKEDRKRADTDEHVDYQAVRNMEAMSFSENEVRQFMEGSKP